MALSGTEVREGHPVRATDLSFKVVNFGSESIWREPFDYRVRIQERSIDFLRRRPQYAVKSDRVSCHESCSFTFLLR
jgi:hypothetical protein